jgi:pimeloyl-ACP methyl ester carboxylesterase
MIATFDVQEPEPIPRWVKERIRATDVDRYMDWWDARPDWGWHPVDALPLLAQPALFVVGEREDPSNTMAPLAAQVPGGRGRLVRIAGQGHVQAFIRGELVLRHVTAFLG